MDIIVGIIWDFAWWIIGIGVALCMVVVLFGILKYSMAQGDPQKAAGARATMFGGAFGVVALPVALIAFRIFFGDVIAPNTGVDAGFLEQNCDRILQSAVAGAAQRGECNVQAKGLISAIQRDKSECDARKTGWGLQLRRIESEHARPVAAASRRQAHLVTRSDHRRRTTLDGLLLGPAAQS